MYKTVLFDLDGTLLNTIDDLADSANRVCAAHGWPQYETAQYRYFVGNGIPKLVERFSPASCRSPEQIIAFFRHPVPVRINHILQILKHLTGNLFHLV